MSNMSSLFPHELQFEPVDPLGDGLADDIVAEQSNPDNLEFQNDIDGQTLAEFWNEVGRDIHKK